MEYAYDIKFIVDIFSRTSWVYNIDKDLIYFRNYLLIFSILICTWQKSADGFNPADLIVPVTQCFWSFATVFLYCYFGECVTHQFNVFYDKLYQRNWYLFPIEMQHMLLIFMLDAQQVVLLRGYGNIVCTRDYFKKVRIKYGFSYKISLIPFSSFRPFTEDSPILWRFAKSMHRIWFCHTILKVQLKTEMMSLKKLFIRHFLS